MHHEYNTLVAIIPSMTKGNNIIKDIYEERFGENTSYGIAYEELYKEVKSAFPVSLNSYN